MSEDTEYLPPHQREENQKEEKAFANVLLFETKVFFWKALISSFSSVLNRFNLFFSI